MALFNSTSDANRTRVRGAWVYPANQVAVAFLGQDERSATVSVRSIATQRGNYAFGQPSSEVQVVGRTLASAKGVSATSFRNADRSVDAVFAFVEPAEAGVGDGAVKVFSIRGTDGQIEPIQSVFSGGPVGPRLPLVHSHRIRIASLIPAMCAGNGPAADGRPSQILLAFLETETDDAGFPLESRIRVGFLSRGGGGWRFNTSALLSTGSSLSGMARRAVPGFEMGLAFDVNRRKWMLGWYGPDYQLLVAVIHFNGLVAVGPTYIESVIDASSHSGVIISYNKLTDRYLIQTEHDVFWARYDSTSNAVSCLASDGATPVGPGNCGGPGVNEASVLIVDGRSAGEVRLPAGNVWASGVDYSPGFEFREGGQYGSGDPQTEVANAVPYDPRLGCPPGDHRRDFADGSRCLTPGGLASLPGFSARSAQGSDRWQFEAPFLWHTPPLGTAVGLHQYVRVPREQLTVAIFVGNTAGRAHVGYTFIDEASEVDFDDVPLRG